MPTAARRSIDLPPLTTIRGDFDLYDRALNKLWQLACASDDPETIRRCCAEITRSLGRSFARDEPTWHHRITNGDFGEETVAPYCELDIDEADQDEPPESMLPCSSGSPSSAPTSSTSPASPSSPASATSSLMSASSPSSPSTSPTPPPTTHHVHPPQPLPAANALARPAAEASDTKAPSSNPVDNAAVSPTIDTLPDTHAATRSDAAADPQLADPPDAHPHAPPLITTHPFPDPHPAPTSSVPPANTS